MPPRKRGRKTTESKSEPEPEPIKEVEPEPEPEPIEEEPIEEEPVEEEPVEEEPVEEEPMEEEVEEEEVEYEEVEEEVEYEEVEEEEEEEEEIEEEQEEEKVTKQDKDANTEKESKVESGSEDKLHAELLSKPPQGSEVYIGGIPTDASEEDLKGFCETSGEVVEVRMVRENNSSENKGYAFISFRTMDMASKAIKELHNSEFKGKKVRCSMSQSKNRIFIGNVPRKWEESDLKNAVSKVGPGIIRVDLMKDPLTKRSRGFAFVEYYNHACADYSLKKLSKSDFKLDTNSPTISWADPRGSSEPGTKSQVKAVYVKNLPKDVAEKQIQELFERHGEIEKVVLPPPKAGHEKRYAFVHFKERANAMKALQNTERYELDGEVLECSLAKPQAPDKKPDSGPTTHRGPSIVMPPYSSRSGYGMGYGSVPPAYLPPPMMAPPGMAMVPMVLPDGRLGYVMQQPAVGPTHHRGNNRGGGRGSGGGRRGRGNDNNRGGKRYHPY
ncbi:RNA-binding protein 47 [Rhynchospora pubera]|uniref:RNA-binding protein 47 n=1 Tax=Rhynchospora pubera TaxID=906938 RepID=A0AAV8F6Z4_9POAL|nr:RNA-binding protein 47 [Rhynchospora pubera]